MIDKNTFNKTNISSTLDKHKVWLIIGISIAVLAILFLFLYSPVKDAIYGKAAVFSGVRCPTACTSLHASCIAGNSDSCNTFNTIGCASSICSISCAAHGDCIPGRPYCVSGVCSATSDVEICWNNLDDDGDGLTDCNDYLDCKTFPDCGYEICDNQLDDDGDGLVDCADTSDCFGEPACAATQPEQPVSCLISETDCAGTCVDTGLDSNNCGACGIVCSGGKSCVNSLCRCPPGKTDCSGTCVVLETDSNNCGSCGNACNSGYECKNNKCELKPISEICDNNKDDDGDLLADCADPDCIDQSCGTGMVCVKDVCTELIEICDDGRDNDEDGLIDCDDSNCNNDPACLEGTGTTPEICDNGIDDDGDGFADCDDVGDCVSYPTCQDDVASCTNGIKDSGETDVDCGGSCPKCGLDKWCSTNSDCENNNCVSGVCLYQAPPTYCQPNYNYCTGNENEVMKCKADGSGYDNPVTCPSGTLLVQYTDGTCECKQEMCYDGVDNDGDGWIDKLDTDCMEICNDNKDNDQDLKVDCADPDCEEKTCGLGKLCRDNLCIAVEIGKCSDGLDNDGDGTIDCDDPDCSGDSACQTVILGDTDGDGCISLTELLSYISSWKSEQVSMIDLLKAIGNWKNPAAGCS